MLFTPKQVYLLLSLIGDVVVDIQELKQFESVYQPSKEIAFCWGVKKYVQLCLEQDYTDIVDHANDSLRIWQAAKAESHRSASLYQWEINHLASANQQLRECAAKGKVVPEGFALVSQKELLELVIAINAVDLSTHTEGKPNEVRKMWQQVALKLDALFSTGESK